MEILQIIPYFYPAWSFGGPVRCVYHIVRALADKGHHVTVVTTNALDPRNDFKADNQEYSVDGVGVIYCRNIAHFSGLYISPKMMRELKRLQDYDIIHMHEYRTFQNVLAYYYAKKCKKPYVITAHGSIPRVVERFLLKELFDEVIGYKILREASKLIALSHFEMKQYIGTGVSKGKVVIVPNGIDTQLIDNLPKSGTFKEKFGLNGDASLILYVGRIHRRKGISFLLEAFARLNDPNVVLVIAGSGDGYMSALREKVTCLKIGRSVKFTGFISERDKLAAYVDSDVVVYPGIYEAFPIVPLEAALCSRPVIVSDDSVMAEIVTDGGFGFSAEYGDISRLRDLLFAVLKDSEMAEEMGRKGRHLVKRNYDWKNVVSQLENVYLKVLGPD